MSIRVTWNGNTLPELTRQDRPSAFNSLHDAFAEANTRRGINSGNTFLVTQNEQGRWTLTELTDDAWLSNPDYDEVNISGHTGAVFFIDEEGVIAQQTANGMRQVRQDLSAIDIPVDNNGPTGIKRAVAGAFQKIEELTQGQNVDDFERLSYSSVNTRPATPVLPPPKKR